MSLNVLTDKTREPLAQSKGTDLPQGRVPTLTVICHPNPRIMGHMTLLDQLRKGEAQPLSRITPDFHTAAGREPGPLADPFLSRKPFFLMLQADGQLRLQRDQCPSAIRVDGESLNAEIILSPQTLEHGVVLVLAERIVLLLHFSDGKPVSDDQALGMVGASSGICAVRAQLQQLLDVDIPVLIRGETGTGKELVAQALHRHGPRAKGTMVSVNLGALPDELAHSEFFGATYGAYTGSKQAQPGYFAAANNGTLFLDELGEASLAVQALLLRVLETGIIYPLGTQRPVKVNPRLISATDADLQAKIADGSFKHTLFQRLNAFEIRLPALRERREDLGRLLRFFLAKEFTALGDPSWLERRNLQDAPFLSADLAERICTYAWPGNLRELRNFVRRLVIQNRQNESLSGDARILEMLAPALATSPNGAEDLPSSNKRRPMSVDQEELLAALEQSGYEPAGAARRLGISRSSLYNLMKMVPGLSIAKDLPEDTIKTALERCSDITRAAQELRVSRKALLARVHELGMLEQPGLDHGDAAVQPES